ncbi:MAG: GTPase [Myxococcaceae bacterium]
MTFGLPDPGTLRDLTGKALALPALEGQREHLERLLDDYARGLASEKRALVIALVGATGAGKSTLLNALVGTAIAVPGDRRPTTEHAVIYAPDDASVGPLAASGTKVVRYPRGAPGPWSGQVFVDTPDLNSVAAEHRERARAIVEQADVALVVLHKGSVAEAVQAEFLEELARRRRLVFVLNHADLLSADSQRILKEQARTVARERLGVTDTEVYAISALAWQQGREDVGERAGLTEALRKLGERTTAERIRRSNALGALREIQSLVEPALEEAQASNDRRAKLLEDGFTRARSTLSDDFTARLDAASAHLGQAVKREASRHFWGPAGWWMQLTMAGTSGLGAAALLVRGNPLLAGGVAVGSALASRLQQFTLERGAERRMEVGALSDDVSLGAAREAVAAARTDAAQAGVSPDRASLPSVEGLAEALARARASVWEATATLSLAEAVKGWWRVARFFLLPLINLPLLALFCHVAYRVVRGYLEANYVGADFLLNALALAGLIAAGGGALASLTLFGVRRRIVSSGRQRFESTLRDLSARYVTAAREGDREGRDAAQRVLALFPDSHPSTTRSLQAPGS